MLWFQVLFDKLDPFFFILIYYPVSKLKAGKWAVSKGSTITSFSFSHSCDYDNKIKKISWLNSLFHYYFNINLRNWILIYFLFISAELLNKNFKSNKWKLWEKLIQNKRFLLPFLMSFFKKREQIDQRENVTLHPLFTFTFNEVTNCYLPFSFFWNFKSLIKSFNVWLFIFLKVPNKEIKIVWDLKNILLL